jgi:hypothetical protein
MTTAGIEIDWTTELFDQLDWHWTNHLRPRMDGLTDEEYLWEPVAGCCTLRRRDDGTLEMPWQFPEPSPPPFTTIAWRLCHIIGPVLRQRAESHFGDGTWRWRDVDWPATAAGALTMLDEAYALWARGVRSLGSDGLAGPCGPAEGPFSTYPMASLVLHINREVIHHGAEVACLRDLYRDQHRSD